MQKYQVELAAINLKRAEEEKNLNAWETLQRYKRDEYNKKQKAQELKNNWQKKKQMANDLRKQMVNKYILFLNLTPVFIYHVVGRARSSA